MWPTAPYHAKAQKHVSFTHWLRWAGGKQASTTAKWNYEELLKVEEYYMMQVGEYTQF